MKEMLLQVKAKVSAMCYSKPTCLVIYEKLWAITEEFIETVMVSEVSCARSIIKSFFCSCSLKCHPSFRPTSRSDYRSSDPVVTVIFFLNYLFAFDMINEYQKGSLDIFILQQDSLTVAMQI